jgi:hypothetical protein
VNKIVDLFTYALMIGGVLVMTRPGSQGPALVGAVTGGFVHIEQAATGQKVS